MNSIKSKKIKREYLFSVDELMSKLNLEGTNLESVLLWSGRSPRQIEEGVSPLKEVWLVITTEEINYGD